MRAFQFVLLAAIALAVTACSSAPNGSTAESAPQAPSSPWGQQPPPPGTSRAADALFGPTVAPAPVALAPGVCPRAEVRDGSNVWRQGGENPTEVRYQATITETARECRIEGDRMFIRVGVEGRVIAGPKGGPGQVTLPIRVAVTRGLSQALWTRLYTLQISVPPGSPSVDFSHVENEVIIQLPTPDELSRTYIFVGFDTQASPEQSRRGRQPRG